MGRFFGTDGFRGEAGKTLTAQHAFRIGQFLGSAPGRGGRPRILVGKDTRRSSDMLECALASGVAAAGGDAFLLGVAPTPCVCELTAEAGFDGGAVISASHNPFPDNGIKLIGADGEKPEDAALAGVEAYLAGTGEIPAAAGAGIGRVFPYEDGRRRYPDRLASLARRDLHGFRIGLDPANGAASAFAGALFSRLGAEVHLIHAAPDGENINREAGSTHPAPLCALVRERHLHAGFAFDGDADRCIAADENGEVVCGDRILYLLAVAMRERGELGDGPVVTTVMSNLGLYRALERAGIGYEQTDVGDRNVARRMRETGSVLGGEQSGHVILLRDARTGDGMLTALRVLETMAETGMPLSALAAPCRMLPQRTASVRVGDKSAVRRHPAVAAALERERAALGGAGRILLRESGTEPVLRVMAEAERAEACDGCVSRLAAVIAAVAGGEGGRG